jgi:hypothetical protein
VDERPAIVAETTRVALELGAFTPTRATRGQAIVQTVDENDIVIAGKSKKRFAVYRFNARGEPCERIAEYDTIDEVRKHHWRFDWDQRVGLRRGECWKYLPLSKFEEWAKGRP